MTSFDREFGNHDYGSTHDRTDKALAEKVAHGPAALDVSGVVWSAIPQRLAPCSPFLRSAGFGCVTLAAVCLTEPQNCRMSDAPRAFALARPSVPQQLPDLGVT
jgi:hypothetical protein